MPGGAALLPGVGKRLYYSSQTAAFFLDRRDATTLAISSTADSSPTRRGTHGMNEPMLIDLKALLVEREDCDAGTVQKLREALAQGGTQFRALRDAADA